MRVLLFSEMCRPHANFIPTIWFMDCCTGIVFSFHLPSVGAFIVSASFDSRVLLAEDSRMTAQALFLQL